MKRRSLARAVALVVLAAAAGTLASCGSAAPRPHVRYPRVSVAVGARPTGGPLAPGFLGFSFEYDAARAYDSAAVIRLIRELVPGQRPMVRIGGNSTDRTWFPEPGVRAPRHARYALSSSWLERTHDLAAALNARMIMGLNLGGGRPQVAAAEARAFGRGIGSSYIAAFEIGNEPDEYGVRYSLGDYIRQFSRWRAALEAGQPVAGPAYATLNWRLGRFIDAEPHLALVTLHRYPLRACLTDRTATGYPTIPRLLSGQSSAGLAAAVAPDVAVARAHGLAFRLDELNSVSCSGKRGVSDTFASALWMLDALFNLAKVGADGVNIHTFPAAAYAPFSATGGAYPEYYGMLLFAQAFSPGARLLPTAVAPNRALTAWATTGSGHAVKVVLINKDPRRTYQVELRVPGMAGRLRVVRLRAPSLSATRGVTIADTGAMSPHDGVYSITAPAASAVLLER